MTEIPIAKWGNSSAIRLPKAVMKELGLKQDQKLQLTVKDGKGILEPVPERPRKTTLEWIVSEMKRLGPTVNTTRSIRAPSCVPSPET